MNKLKTYLVVLLERTPENPDFYCLYATAYLKQGKSEDAIDLLNKASY